MMRLPLYSLLVWLAIAAIALALASGWWDNHPAIQVAYVFIGATSTTLALVALRGKRLWENHVEAGVCLLLIECIDFLSRMIVSPLLLQLAAYTMTDGLMQSIALWALLLNSRLREWLPVLLLGIATLRLDSRLWGIACGLLVVLKAMWLVPAPWLNFDSLPTQQIARLAAMTSVLSLVVVALTCLFDIARGKSSQRSWVHWAGTALFSLRLVTNAAVEWARS